MGGGKAFEKDVEADELVVPTSPQERSLPQLDLVNEC